MKILFTAVKGGVGKSTLISNIAATLAGMGKDVLVMDGDKQGTSYYFHQYRLEGDNLPAYQCTQCSNNIREAIIDASKRFDIVLVDTAGYDSPEARSAMATCDLVITPFSVSQPDLDTVALIIKAVDDMKIINPDMHFYGLLNMVSTHHQKNDELTAHRAVEELDIEIMDSCISRRDIYMQVMADGLSVTETNNKLAAAEITALVEEVLIHVE